MEMFEKRNNDFMAIVERLMKESAARKRPLPVPAAVRKALKEPAPRFYLTREHVWKKLLERRRKRLPPREKPHRRRMWDEIEQALEARRKKHPHEDEWWALDHVLECHRPSGFFLTEDYARRLVYRGIRNRKNANTTHS